MILLPEETKKELTAKEKQMQAYLEFFNKKANFASLSKSIVQDLINNRKESVLFKRYSKEKVIGFLENPQANEKEIRNMSNFLYANSSHYKRLCNNFSKMATLNYTINSYNLKPNYSKSQYSFDYRKVVTLTEKLNMKYHLPTLFNVCMYQDTFYGLWFETANSFDIAPINPDYCKITSKVDSCLIYSLDFEFFKTRKYLLSTYGEEINTMYNNYVGYEYIDSSGNKVKVKGNPKLRWQEPPNQICFKVNNDQLYYSLPPFAGIFPEILNLEDYKLLKKSGEILNRYKLLVMQIPLGENGEFKLDEILAEKFYNQACNNVDAGIGIILSPMEVKDISFQNNSTRDSDAVNEAEISLWSASGSNGALYGSGDKLSSSSLSISTKSDETIVFSLLRQVEAWINKHIKEMDLFYNFKVIYLNQTIYSQDDVCNRYFKAATSGVRGSKSLYAASVDLSPSDILNFTELEDILDYDNNWQPLISSNTQSGKDDVGRPTNDSQGKGLTDSGEQTKEGDENVR